MAVRKKLSHDMKTREKIRTSQLINRLMSHIDGDIELSQSQVRGIEILLKKTLPDLQATTISGDEDNPLKTDSEITVRIVSARPDDTGKA